jgi:hypothetical protein
MFATFDEAVLGGAAPQRCVQRRGNGQRESGERQNPYDFNPSGIFQSFAETCPA